MRSPGIHTRLLLAVLMIISLTSCTLGYIGVKTFHKFVQSRFEERFLFLAKYLALNSELGILIDQRSMLDRLAENLLSERDVAKVMIYNNSGEILAAAAKVIPGPFDTVEAPVRLKESNDESLAFHGVFQAPMTNRPVDIIGKVEIIFSTSQINSLLKIITFRFIWLTAGLAGLCLIIFFFMSRSLISPLTRLVQTARMVGEGELQRRTIPGNIPETREVALAFNSMLDSLERGRKAVEAVNREMAQQNLLAEMGKFSMMIAHEIKNPLGIIKSSFDVLKKDPADPSNKIIVGYIEEEIARINGLIEDFLSFAKPAKPSFRIVDANAMLKECIDRFGRMTTAQQMEVNCRIPEASCLSYLDPDLFRRAIDNILKNAAEACGESGVISVYAQCLAETWEVDITDNGVGISDEIKDKIFDPFVTTRSKGTGLGLAYTAQVIQAHNGSIVASNRRSNGARFHIEIPREPKIIDLYDTDGVNR